MGNLLEESAETVDVVESELIGGLANKANLTGIWVEAGRLGTLLKPSSS